MGDEEEIEAEPDLCLQDARDILSATVSGDGPAPISFGGGIRLVIPRPSQIAGFPRRLNVTSDALCLVWDPERHQAGMTANFCLASPSDFVPRCLCARRSHFKAVCDGVLFDTDEDANTSRWP